MLACGLVTSRGDHRPHLKAVVSLLVLLTARLALAQTSLLFFFFALTSSALTAGQVSAINHGVGGGRVVAYI